MKAYFLSENLKVKRTLFWPLSWAGPAGLAILAFLLTADYFQIDLYNWWYSTIFPGVLALSCCISANTDKKQKYRGILGIPADLKKVWGAKILVLLGQVGLSCLLLFPMSVLGGLLNTSVNFHSLSWLSALSGSLLLALVYSWQVPLWLWLGNKLGVFLTMTAAVAVNIIGQIFCSLKDWWFLMPFSYGGRMMCPVLGVLPNGLPAVKESMTFSPEVMTTQGWLPALLISAGLLALGTWAGGNWFCKREAV